MALWTDTILLVAHALESKRLSDPQLLKMVLLKSISLILALLAGLITASAIVARDNNCVPDHVAKKLVTTFEYFFTRIDPELANKTLTKDFTLYSDSQLFTSPGVTPVCCASRRQSSSLTASAQVSGTPIYTSRAAFVAALLQTSAPAGSPNFFVTLDTFHSCDKIAFRWEAPGGFGGKYPIRGIDTLDLAFEHGDWKIKADYSEYNNVGFITGIGCTISCPSS